MVETGYAKNGVQCRDNIKKLKVEYKKIKDNNNESGRDRKIWRFYDCMNDILGLRMCNYIKYYTQQEWR